MTERETFQQQVREQAQYAEQMVQDGLNTWSALTLATAEVGLAFAEQGLRSSQEVLTTYRRLYNDGIKTWQNYIERSYETVNRATRATLDGTTHRSS